ncbi:MAG TPA: phosphoribosylformylglycinamidine synthase subunit PurQ [Actinomycetaceae bacterium]|nr:phosphoribosylformylglycinamidine synthase subunit PurQ [Actinomycetaceae bacterium]
MTARIGIVTFPGSLDERDAARAVRIAGGEEVSLWHGDSDLHGVDAVVLPGGYSYGNYLRGGAIASFAPIMSAVADAARDGMPVLGVGNGFQILCEAQLLPGALLPNGSTRFICRDLTLRVETNATAWTGQFDEGEKIRIPVKTAEGNFSADDATLDQLEGEGRVVLRYVGENPIGSLRSIAGVSNAAGNVVGLIPSPEHAVEAGYGPDGTFGPRTRTDGTRFFSSVMTHLLASSAR